MKTFVVLALSALAVVSAQTVPACDITKLAPVAVTGANAKACQTKTTYSAATATIPTGELLKTVCSTKECNDLLTEMKAAVPTPCTFAGKDIKTDVIDKFPAACAAALGGAAANTTAGASNSTTAAPNATTAAPSTTTAAPATTTATPVTTAPAATTKTNSSTPATTTKAPSPTPKSNAAVLTVAASAVATSVLAALL